MYMGLLLVFRQGLYIFLYISKVTSKKSAIFRFVLTTIDSPRFLNILTVALFFHSVSGLVMFLKYQAHRHDKILHLPCS